MSPKRKIGFIVDLLLKSICAYIGGATQCTLAYDITCILINSALCILTYRLTDISFYLDNDYMYIRFDDPHILKYFVFQQLRNTLIIHLTHLNKGLKPNITLCIFPSSSAHHNLKYQCFFLSFVKLGPPRWCWDIFVVGFAF